MGWKTPLYAWHAANGARIVDFGGWDMPVVYSSIISEHQATREAAGLFDISHMGRFRFQGPDAGGLLDHCLTNRVDNLKLGQVRYSLCCNESGGILDDVLLTRFEFFYLLVVNASNRKKLLEWFESQRAGSGTRITDETNDWAMIACQGPRSLEIAQPLVPAELGRLRNYFATQTTYEGSQAIASRTGYTGEDGLELIVPAEKIEKLWTELLESAAQSGIRPVGLGARDTLRLEAGMPLYGHELSEEIDPLQAGLGWAVKSRTKDFIGKEAILAREANRPVRVGLRLADKRIGREGFAITHLGQPVGTVTSGTFSPTLQASLAMGYVKPEQSNEGTELDVVIRGKPVRATVVSLPFYKRKRSDDG